MTNDQWDNLTYEQRDSLVYTKLWAIGGLPGCQIIGLTSTGNGMMLVIERMRELGKWVFVGTLNKEQSIALIMPAIAVSCPPAGIWGRLADIIKFWLGRGLGNVFTAQADSAPSAVALAALRALGVK